MLSSKAPGAHTDTRKKTGYSSNNNPLISALVQQVVGCDSVRACWKMLRTEHGKTKNLPIPKQDETKVCVCINKHLLSSHRSVSQGGGWVSWYCFTKTRGKREKPAMSWLVYCSLFSLFSSHSRLALMVPVVPEAVAAMWVYVLLLFCVFLFKHFYPKVTYRHTHAALESFSFADKKGSPLACVWCVPRPIWAGNFHHTAHTHTHTVLGR